MVEITIHEIESGREKYHEFLNGMSGGFYSSLFALIPHSDHTNRRKLLQAFPSEVFAYLEQVGELQAYSSSFKVKPPDSVIMKRDADGAAYVNIPHLIQLHSPDGFEWGYSGSGPAELALNVLALYITPYFAKILHQDFKREVIQNIPHEGGELKAWDIHVWIKGRIERGREE